LQKLGIATTGLAVIDEALTAQCFITSDLDDNQIAAFHPGAMTRSALNTTSSQPAAWGIVAPDARDAMFAHAGRMRANGVPFIFDLGQAMTHFQRDDLARMLTLAQALTVNDYEAGVIEERLGRPMADIARDLQAAIVTRGAAGATLYTDGTATDIPAVAPEAVVDPTGCGDAHRAGLLYGRTLGWSWVDSARLASLMGALKVASRGAQNHTPTRAAISARLQAEFGLALP